MPENSPIFHIAYQNDINELKTNNNYRCDSLKTEGFIHCCDKEQLPGVVNRYYQGIDDLKLLRIDPDKLTYELIRENTVGGSELFPHIYGPINAEAINEIIEFSLKSPERTELDR